MRVAYVNQGILPVKVRIAAENGKAPPGAAETSFLQLHKKLVRESIRRYLDAAPQPGAHLMERWLSG